MHVQVSTGFLESVEKNVICQRPAWRVDTAQVDMHCDYVLIMSDHSLFTRGMTPARKPLIYSTAPPRLSVWMLSIIISS
jgi:inositol-pentakisphosphate 2-kinase